MNISAPFIVRPVATTLLIVAVLLVGVFAYRTLPVAALPTVNVPTIQVVTTYPGASPNVMQSSVSAPLEHYLGRIPGLVLMTSSSSYGLSQITLQFNLNRTIASAAKDVQAAINAATGWLPLQALPSRPIYREVNPADMPILVLALTSETMPMSAIAEFASTAIVPKLSQVQGVGAVTIQGGATRAVRLQVNPRKLAALGLSLLDVRDAIRATSVDAPKGRIDGPRQAFQVGNNDQLLEFDAFLDAVIAYRNGAPVTFGDIGEAVEGLEDERVAGWYNGKRAIILNVERQPGANIISVADEVRKLLPDIEVSSPRALEFAVAADRTVTIRASVHDVQRTLAITVALVVMVIFLFLRKLWATVIPSVVLPVSLIATFAVMAAAGFSLNNISLMALAVASGFIVDDAIVMIENIARHMEMGERPLQAALKGARQIGFTIVSLTLSLVAVFIPLLFMGGVIGLLFHEFAITLSAAVIISLLVSLTLTPMMCAKLLKPEDAHSQGRLFRASERGFDFVRAIYEGGLRWTLRHQTMMLVVTVLTAFASVWLYIVIPKGFVPEQDTGLIAGVTDTAHDVSFQRMSELQKKIAHIISEDPDVLGVTSFVGIGTENATINSGRLYINIGPPDQREADVNEIMDRIGAAVAREKGIALNLQPVQDVQIETKQSRTAYQYVLQSLDETELRFWADKFIDALRAQHQLADIATDQQELGQELMITVNREAAARFGVNMEAVDQTLYSAFGQQKIATIYSQTYQYPVILEVAPDYRDSESALDSIYVTPADAIDQNRSERSLWVSPNFGTKGNAIPLSAFVERERRLAPLLITHQDQFPAITVSFNLAAGVSLGEALQTIERTKAEIGLPKAIETSFVGRAAEFSSSLRTQPFLIAAAIIAVYIVLGILYESYIHPITILSTMPSAGVGALLALMLLGYDLNLISLIGIILLIGIVKKNGIMMVDFALAAERQEGKTPEDAIFQACLIRFRPIMMTTMAALLGALPLAIDGSTGSELRRPLGIAVVGGLLVSQFLTLFTTPVIYLAFDRLERRFRRLGKTASDKLRATAQEPQPAEASRQDGSA